MQARSVRFESGSPRYGAMSHVVSKTLDTLGLSVAVDTAGVDSKVVQAVDDIGD